MSYLQNDRLQAFPAKEFCPVWSFLWPFLGSHIGKKKKEPFGLYLCWRSREGSLGKVFEPGASTLASISFRLWSRCLPCQPSSPGRLFPLLLPPCPPPSPSLCVCLDVKKGFIAASAGHIFKNTQTGEEKLAPVHAVPLHTELPPAGRGKTSPHSLKVSRAVLGRI